MSVIEYQPLYSIKETAEVLKTNRTEVYNLMNQGRLKYIVLGSRRVKGADLEQFINSLQTEN